MNEYYFKQLLRIRFDEINDLQHYCLLKMNESSVMNIHIDG